MSRFQKLLIWLSPRKQFIPTQISIVKKWLGSSYGGFFVHTPLMNESSTVLSFGVGKDVSFDLALMSETNCNVHTFDPTRGVAEFIAPYLKKHQKLAFSPLGISTREEEAVFYPPNNPHHISCSVVPNQTTKDKAYRVKMKDLGTICDELSLSNIDLLKLDIEGAEYEVIPNILESRIPIAQILLEIHPNLFPDGRQKTNDLLEKLRQAGYLIFGVSNTCRELSLIHREHLRLNS